MLDLFAEIAFNKRLTSDTWFLGLRAPEIAERARPGHFVMIRITPGLDPLLRRPFSICGVKEDLFLVLYRVVGRGTALLTEAGVGQKLAVLGPLGRGFDVPEGGRRCVLVGGGIGVAPLFFLAQRLRGRKFQFMTGFRSASEIIRLEHGAGGGGELLIATDDGTEGHTGPVTDLLERTMESGLSETERLTIFACGPKAMLKRLAKITVPRKVSCQVSLEAAMACGLGACQGCAVKSAAGEERPYYHVCKDGPVFAVEAVDWSLL